VSILGVDRTNAADGFSGTKADFSLFSKSLARVSAKTVQMNVWEPSSNQIM
jgi:hypothetical protein